MKRGTLSCRDFLPGVTAAELAAADGVCCWGDALARTHRPQSESRKAWEHTVDILGDIVSRPPIILRGKERTERKLRGDEVDNAEAVVDVQSAEIVL